MITCFSSFVQSQNKGSVDTLTKGYIKKSKDFMNVNLDSSLYYGDKALKLLSKFSADSDKIKLYNTLGSIHLARGNYINSLEYHLKAKKIVETCLLTYSHNQKCLEAQVETLTDLGTVYLQQNNFDQALSYFNEAMLFLDKNKLENRDAVANFKMKLLNNTAAIFTIKGEFNKALEYYTAAKELISGKGDKKAEASLINNIGICHMENKEYILSAFYFEQALNIRKSLGDKRGIAQCYNNLGKNYALNRNYDKAEEYFQKALNLGRSIGNTESILRSLESLSTLYNETKEYKQAFVSFNDLTNIKDSLFNAETVKQIAQLEMHHKLEMQKEIFDLDTKRRDAEKEKAKLTYYIIGGSLIFLLIMSVLFIYLQKSKIRNITLSKEKLELEHKNTNLEKEKLQEEIAFKNRELTSKVMYLLRKNELISQVSDKLILLKKNSKLDNQMKIQEMITEMRTKTDKNSWDEFETYFIRVHSEFYTKLNKLFPDLTSNEKKLCAFLRLNLTTKDISGITYQSINSITVSRTRLRKKLNISGEDVNLTNFLMDL